VSYIKKIQDLTFLDRKSIIFIVIIYLFIAILEIITLKIISFITEYLVNFSELGNYYKAWLGLDVETTLIISVCILLFMISLKFFSQLSLNFLLMKNAIKNEIILKLSLSKRYLLSDHGQFYNEDSGYYLYHFQQLSKSFSEFVLLPIIRGIGDVCVIFVIAIYLAYEDLLLFSVFFMTFAVFIFIYDKLFKAKLSQYGKNFNLALEQMVSDFDSMLLGKDQIFIYRNGSRVISKIKELGNIYNKNYTVATIISNLPRYLVEVVIGIAVSLYISLAIVFEINFQSIMVSLGLLGFAGIRLIPLMNQLMVSLNQINANCNSIDRLHADLFNKFVPSKDYNISQTKGCRTLVLRNATFDFYGNRPSIKFPDLKLNVGTIVSIVGRSGSGKTTFLKLITGLLKFGDGTEFYLKDGSGLKGDVDQNLIAYSPQNIYISNGSIRENILFGSPENTEKLGLVLEVTCLNDVIGKLEEGLETYINGKNLKLSGGQMQRVQIARALYSDRPIIVLDEPTSALNFEISKKIFEGIRLAFSDRIVVIVTHDEDILPLSDQVIRID